MSFEELNRAFNEIHGQTAQFVRMAFHLHSPGSHDWGRSARADAELNDRTRFEGSDGIQEFLNELANEYDIVCVTDHMKSSYACQLAQAAQSRSDITVFPGMEINCIVPPAQNHRIHLLAIFPPEKNVTAIDRIFLAHPDFPPEDQRNGSEDFHVTPTLEEWKTQIALAGGILVLAHIEEHQRGHRAYFRSMRDQSCRMFVVDTDDTAINDQRQISEEYKSYIANLQPHALEIRNPADRHHYVAFGARDGLTHNIPCVATCDAHCVEDFARRERKTFIKVSRTDFQCVKDALRFFPTRVRFADDLPDKPSPRLIGVRLRSPSGNGLFQEALIGFNGNLNCIIGPRGCGKSTIIEALRYALGLNKNLTESSTADSAEIGFAELARRIQRANLCDTLIEIIYELNTGEPFCLYSNFDPQESFATEVFDLQGNLRPLSFDAFIAEYPVRLYGWSEIESLGRRPELQRAVLDRLIGGLPELLEERENLYSQLALNRTELTRSCQQLASKLVEEDGLLQRYTQYKTEFETINTPEVAALFERLDQARDQLEILDGIRDQLAQFRDTLDDSAALDTTAMVNDQLEGKPENLREWWDAEVGPRLRLAEVSDVVANMRSQVQTRIAEKESSLNSLIRSVRQIVEAQKAAIRERTHASPDEELVRGKRELSKQRFELVAQKRTDYLAFYEEFEAILKQRNELIDQLTQKQDSISAARSESQQALNARLNDFRLAEVRISATFDGGRDRDNVAAYMRDGAFLSQEVAGKYKSTRYAERCCEMAAPQRIARAMLKSDLEEFEKEGHSFDDNQSPLSRDEASTLVRYFNPFAQDDDANVPIVDRGRLEQIASLQEQRWDDEVRICLNDRPVDRLSPGQRSSAMLPLIALSESVPLIIDQPEDNLDNRIVGQMLTRILSELKEHRQIIVTTHNPNIVVGGDAEQVIVLHAADDRRAEVEKMGSIDDPSIIESVIGIMEGGREAFKARERRYEGYLNH